MADLNVKVYNITGTFPLVPGNAKAEDVLPLAAVITDTIAPQTWEAFGGDGSLRAGNRAAGTRPGSL